MPNEPKIEGLSAAPEKTDVPLAQPAPPVISSAIVIERRKGGKDRKRYSKGTKGGQRILFGLSKAGFRVANALAEGTDTFVKRSDSSRSKRKDGFLRDSLRNASRGFSDGFSELGKAPEEIADRISTRRVWRTFRVISPFFGR